MPRARQTHCKRGHELRGSNIRWSKTYKGTLTRACKTCHKAAKRARYAANPEKERERKRNYMRARRGAAREVHA